jgi:SAM-dependent methyltransferase
MPQPMDDASDLAHWDRKFKEGLPSLATPDPFFVSAYQSILVQSLPSGRRALDLAAGLGRHALWLAERAWQVSAVDVSAVAIEKLGQTARHLNVDISLFTMDVAKYTFEPAGFDLVVLFYYLDRNLFPKIISALKPGGMFICKMAMRWMRLVSMPPCERNYRAPEKASAKPQNFNPLLYADLRHRICPFDFYEVA